MNTIKKGKILACLNCKKAYYCNRYRINRSENTFCSKLCYYKYRWKSEFTGKCRNCGKPATTIYCSQKCSKDFWNKNDYRLRKKQKMWEEKLAIIEELGGKCIDCGIADIRVLEINHINPAFKRRFKDKAYTTQRRLRDWKKNIGNLNILCANCHRIHTWLQQSYINPEDVEKAKARILMSGAALVTSHK